MASAPDTPWTDAPLVALDLEGTGAQDHDDEAILEIALVPLTAGRPSLTDAYTTLLNPGRPIQHRPWISPGLTNTTLADAPSLSDVEPELARRIRGKVLVGHNVAVDWRLLHRRCPTIRPAGLIDTLRLARHIHGGARKSLSALLEHYTLTDQVTRLAQNSQPHRALWDTTGAALLLTALIRDLPNAGSLTFTELHHVSGLGLPEDRRQPETQQLPLI